MTKKKNVQTSHLNPPMPEPPPSITVDAPVQLSLLHDFDRYSNGLMLMKLSDTNCEVTRGDEKVGAIGMAIGGTIYIDSGSRLWAFDTIQLFEAVLAAEKEQYLKG